MLGCKLCFLLIGVAFLTGCSKEFDSEACYTMELDDESAFDFKYIKVGCAPPVHLEYIWGKTRPEVEELLGPRVPAPEGVLDSDQAFWYLNGSVLVFYHGENDTVDHMVIHPKDLDFTAEAILEYLSLTELNGTLMQRNDEINWVGDNIYGNVLTQSRPDNPNKVLSIDVMD